MVGVQLVTSKGSVIIGRNKYSKNLDVWTSPRLGWFEKNGKPKFFHIEHKKNKSTHKFWEIVWEWDELYLNNEKEPLMKFAPSEEEKNASIETLSSLCNENNSSNFSCHWNISNKISLEALTKKFLCVSDLSSEFYGGAHPIALRRFGTYSIENKKFVRLDEFITDTATQKQIWLSLFKNINDVMQQSFFGSIGNVNSSKGGIDSLFAPSGNDLSKPDQTSKEKLTSLLNSQGYTFSPNVFCPVIRAEGPFLLFGFPHSEQVNRGLNYRAEAILDQQNLPKNVLDLYSDYKFSKPGKDGSVSLLSKDLSWRLQQKRNKVSIKHKNKHLKLSLPETEESSEEILGIFWVYKSPSISYLEKNKFKKLKIASNQKLVDLSKYLIKKS